MPRRQIDPNRPNEDWQGNNMAIACPVCGKVFIISGHLHPTGRECPVCRESTGRVQGGRDSGGAAEIHWTYPAD